LPAIRIGLNYLAIGIENVGGADAPTLTKSSIEKPMKTDSIPQAENTNDYVIGHHEYQTFKTYPTLEEEDPDLLTVNTEPRRWISMGKIRKNLSDLFLKEKKPIPSFWAERSSLYEYELPLTGLFSCFRTSFLCRLYYQKPITSFHTPHHAPSTKKVKGEKALTTPNIVS